MKTKNIQRKYNEYSRDKKNNAKIKGSMWCQLLYLIPGAILCSKFKSSDVSSVKPPLLQSFSFLFFIEKIENIQSKCVRTHQIWTPLPCTHPYALVMTPPSPICLHTLWIALKHRLIQKGFGTGQPV